MNGAAGRQEPHTRPRPEDEKPMAAAPAPTVFEPDSDYDSEDSAAKRYEARGPVLRAADEKPEILRHGWLEAKQFFGWKRVYVQLWFGGAPANTFARKGTPKQLRLYAWDAEERPRKELWRETLGELAYGITSLKVRAEKELEIALSLNPEFGGNKTKAKRLPKLRAASAEEAAGWGAAIETAFQAFHPLMIVSVGSSRTLSGYGYHL